MGCETKISAADINFEDKKKEGREQDAPGTPDKKNGQRPGQFGKKSVVRELTVLNNLIVRLLHEMLCRI